MKTIVHVHRQETFWSVWVAVVACIVMMFCMYGCKQTNIQKTTPTDMITADEEDLHIDLPTAENKDVGGIATKSEAERLTDPETTTDNGYREFQSLKAYYNSGYLQYLAKLMQSDAFVLRITYGDESTLTADVILKSNDEESYRRMTEIATDQNTYVKSIIDMIKTDTYKKVNVKDLKIRCLFWDYSSNLIAEKTY